MDTTLVRSLRAQPEGGSVAPNVPSVLPPALVSAVKAGSEARVREVMEVAGPGVLNARTQNGGSILFLCLQHRRRTLASTLVALGADPNAPFSTRTKSPWRPIQAAVSLGWAEWVEALLRAGASVEERATDGMGPLALAVASAAPEDPHWQRICGALIAAGANPWATDMAEPGCGESSIERARARGLDGLADYLAVAAREHRLRVQADAPVDEPEGPAL